MRSRSGSIKLASTCYCVFPLGQSGGFFIAQSGVVALTRFSDGGSMRDGKVLTELFRIRNRGCQSRMSGHRAAKSRQDLSAHLLARLSARLLAHERARYRGREWDQYSCKPAIPITRCAEFTDIIRRFFLCIIPHKFRDIIPALFFNSAREKTGKEILLLYGKRKS